MRLTLLKSRGGSGGCHGSFYEPLLNVGLQPSNNCRSSLLTLIVSWSMDPFLLPFLWGIGGVGVWEDWEVIGIHGVKAPDDQ